MNNIAHFFKKHINELEKKTYNKDSTIFIENDECKKIGFIKRGEISIKSYFSNGKEVTYNVLREGEMFGNNLIFSSSPRYRGDVITNKESEIIFINKDKLIKMLESDEEFLISYLSNQSDFSKKLNLKIKLLTIASAQDRLLYYLTFNNGKLAYKSITSLANELYLTRESLSRTIKKLKETQQIKVSGKTITLMVE